MYKIYHAMPKFNDMDINCIKMVHDFHIKRSTSSTVLYVAMQHLSQADLHHLPPLLSLLCNRAQLISLFLTQSTHITKRKR